MNDFAEKRVLITGGARGLGYAFATAFLHAGARVALWDVNAADLAAAGKSLGGLGSVETAAVDISNPEQVRGGFAALGAIDVLVNNAGIQYHCPAAELTDERWRQVLSINLDGAFYCAREAAKGMTSRGRGAIINIASCTVGFGLPHRTPYVTSKGAIVQLTRSLAAEWAQAGVRVNAVAPGYVLTRMVSDAFDRGDIKRDEIEAKIALRRLAEPEEIAQTVLFLASSAASYVTGQTLYVDGGYSISK